VFVLVRHAHAGSKRTWTGDDGLRPLSDRGLRQAMALVGPLAAVRPRRLLSSPLLRCRQTLEPLARTLGMAIEDVPLLAPDADVERLSLLVRQPGTADAVLCTHGETLALLFTHWQADGRLSLGVPVRELDKTVTQKAGAWIVEDDGALLRGRYLPAPEPAGRT
jgi:phosphohistidine phosphatase SixA